MKNGMYTTHGDMGEIMEKSYGRLRNARLPLPRSETYFRTQGAEAGVPLEVMMAQLGHMDRRTSLEYVRIQEKAFARLKR